MRSAVLRLVVTLLDFAPACWGGYFAVALQLPAAFWLAGEGVRTPTLLELGLYTAGFAAGACSWGVALMLRR